MRLRPELAQVTESPLVQIATLAEGMPGSIKLCYGESDLPTPDFICRAADEAARAGHTFYTHTAGCTALRDAIAQKIHQLHGVTYGVPEVMATVGAIDGDLHGHSRHGGAGRQCRVSLARVCDLSERHHHGRRRAAPRAARLRWLALHARSRSRARRNRRQHPAADRQQPVEPDRLDDDGRRAARTRQPGGRTPASSSSRTKSTSG